MVRPALPSGDRTVAITVRLCTSRPRTGQRSPSIGTRSIVVGTCRPGGQAYQESDTRARSNNWGSRGNRSDVPFARSVPTRALTDACRPTHQSDLRAHGTSEAPGYGSRHGESFIPTGGPRQGHAGLTWGFTA